jgi:hypothetical protein
MQLSRFGREYYELQIATTSNTGSPIPADGWEASFDRGVTWIAATVVTHDAADWSAWLVAGVDAEEGSAVAVLSASVSPLVRAVDNPEIVVRSAPRISVM